MPRRTINARVAAAKKHIIHHTAAKQTGGAVATAKRRGVKKHSLINTSKLLTIHIHK